MRIQIIESSHGDLHILSLKDLTRNALKQLNSLNQATEDSTITPSKNQGSSSNPVIISETRDIEEKERKTAVSISQQYLNKKDCFSGKLGEDIHQFFRDYETTASDFQTYRSTEVQICPLHVWWRSKKPFWVLGVTCFQLIQGNKANDGETLRHENKTDQGKTISAEPYSYGNYE